MVDKKSNIDIESRLDKTQARKLLSEFFNTDPNLVSYSSHALQRMRERDLMAGDVINVIRSGEIIDEPEFEKNSWRYKVETTRIAVIVAFNNPNHIIVVSTWRKA